MKKVTEETSAGKSEARRSGLDDLIQQGARQIVQQAIEAELAALLERYNNVKTLDGRRTVIRNGYLPEREVVTAIGPVTVSRIGVIEPGMIGIMRPPEVAPKRDFEGTQECVFLPDFATAFSLFSGIGLGLRKLSPSITTR